ncbi:MAG: type II secretion system protein [Candidatus Pacebacteria bacterium]|nr:type II secretion system protein [Candidatus Paceibacterota bacterium]
MYTHRSRGFTLIELLVVIAIIGVLSAVVLASLNTARQKGNDAAIQSDLSTIQTEAEIFYGGGGGNTIPNSYGVTVSTCADATGMFYLDSVIRKAIAGAESANGTASSMSCFGSGTAYAISSPLSSDAAKHWCVDSTGSVGVRTTGPATGTECPAI